MTERDEQAMNASIEQYRREIAEERRKLAEAEKQADEARQRLRVLRAGERTELNRVRDAELEREGAERKRVCEEVCQMVAREFGVQVADIYSHSRELRFTVPRQAAIQLLAGLCHWSSNHIAQLLGGRHHSSVLHGLAKMQARRLADPQVEARMVRLEMRAEAMLRGLPFKADDTRSRPGPKTLRTGRRPREAA